MDKSSVYEKFTSYVDLLRHTECSQKQKITCFQQIAECIQSPAMVAHINYAAHCGTATNVLLLFCEDLDSVVRMSAEENLNKIFRTLEKTRVSRILMDLYGEIKRNGNQRSLRICLNLFSYYAPQIKEKHIKWYAVRLHQCMAIISQRKETLLQETLCEFVKQFARHVQQGLNDSETCKLFEIFLANINADCAVKRRCSAQNCISLIEHARNRSLMAKHGLNKVIELLLTDQQSNAVLGALGLLRLLLPQLIRGYNADYNDDGDSLAGGRQQASVTTTTASDCRQIIEIYDYCLHLLSTQHTTNHAIINASLEVINSILLPLDAATPMGQGHGADSLAQSLRQLLCNQQLQHNEYLRRRKSLKNQIFQLKNYQVPTTEAPSQQQQQPTPMQKNANGKLNYLKCQQQEGQKQLQHHQQQQQLPSSISSTVIVGINAVADDAKKDAPIATGVTADATADEVRKTTRQQIRNAARSISECVFNDSDADGDTDAQADAEGNDNGDDDDDDVELLGDDEYDDFTTLSQLNEPQQAPSTAVTLLTTKVVAADKLIDVATADAASAAVAVAVAAASTSVSTNDGALPKPQAVQHQSSLQNLLATDDKSSQHLSDIDNESFNSIDFDAEITIAGSTIAPPITGESNPPTTSGNTITTNATTTTSNDGTTIGTFFNNLLTHSNAASESVSKLFRQSSGAKSTPSKSVPDKSDAVSAASLTLSLSSLASSSLGPHEHEQQQSVDDTPTPLDESCSATGSYTASTAVLMDAPATTTGAKEDPEVELRRTPNANPFLKESSPLKQTVAGHVLINVQIGTIFEQPLIRYTARLITIRFLLTGQAGGLQADSLTRVSIKSLALTVLAQCVRLVPRVLQLRLEISEAELELLEEAEGSGANTQASSAVGSPQSSTNSQLGADYEKFETNVALLPLNEQDESLLLDIKDDHFGTSTCAYLQQSPLNCSVDTALLQQHLQARRTIPSPHPSVDLLSKSDIIATGYRVTVAAEDSPPRAAPPRPPLRTKSMRKKSEAAAAAIAAASVANASPGNVQAQAIADILLFHQHTDPILRGGVQQIVGNFVQATRAGLSLTLERRLCLQHLLAILLKGFEDDIHTVVIQALNAFDKIFPHVVSKYLTAPPCHYHAHQQQQHQQHQQEAKEKAELRRPSVESAQQKRPDAEMAQKFGQQSFPKSLDNALSSQHQQHQQQQKHQVRDENEMQTTMETTEQRLSNDGRCVDNSWPGICHNRRRRSEAESESEAGYWASLNTTCAIAGTGTGSSTSTGTTTTTMVTDNDELLAALLNDFELQSNCMATTTTTTTSNNNSNNNNTTNIRTTHIQGMSSLCNEPEMGGEWPCCMFAISPKLLLSKLRLCHHNKYWLVQNKYAEVISNLNYVLLRSYYGNAGCDFDNTSNSTNNNNNNRENDDGNGNDANHLRSAAYDKDIVCTYEEQFLTELLQLLGEDDARVREHAAACLCRFIMQTSLQPYSQQRQWQQHHQQQQTHRKVGGGIGSGNIDGNINISAVNSKGSGSGSTETQQTNFNLLWDFFDYRIFGSMSVTLRNLFRTSSTIAPPLAELDALGGGGGGGCGGVGVGLLGGGSGIAAAASGAMASASMATITTATTSAAAASTLWTTCADAAMLGIGAASASAYFAGSCASVGGIVAGGVDMASIADGHVFPFQRQIAHEEKVLAKVLYRLTNKLMTLNDKNTQFGIIYALRLLLRYFNFVDYQQAWQEFNFIEICQSYAYYNSTTAADLNCQNDLIDVMAKLIAGTKLSSSSRSSSSNSTSNLGKSQPEPHLNFLLGHTTKLLNIYYHLVSNQRPRPQSHTKAHRHKTDIFTLSGSSSGGSGSSSSNAGTRGGEGGTPRALGYFAGDYVYMKLYNILRGANDSYKITINHDAGNLLICLLRTSLNSLSLCLELSPPPTTTTTISAASPSAVGGGESTEAISAMALKLIEEILEYLSKLINYAPGECVACLRQLLKYLFGQNYGSRLQSAGHHDAFIRPYFAAKGIANGATINSGAVAEAMIVATSSQNLIEAAPSATTTTPRATVIGSRAPTAPLGVLFGQGLHMQTPAEGDCARLIKLFEPLVIYCLTLFMKSNAVVQAPILELLSQLLELNVNYSILDSKNVIFEQMLNNLDLIESGIDRNAFFIVPPMLRVLIQLTMINSRQLITIPKIISITNNLLANGSVRDIALLALKTLSYELFFMHSEVEGTLNVTQSSLTATPTAETKAALLIQRRELDTQKEVVLGMLEKFMESRCSQQVVALLLLYERSSAAAAAVTDDGSYDSAIDADALYALLCRTLCAGQLRAHTLADLRLLESCFRNNGNNVLGDSKAFLQLLELFFTLDVGNFGDLAHATIILANVILKTEEIYLVNHIKLYLKNHPAAITELELRLPTIATSTATTTKTRLVTTSLSSWQDDSPSTSSAAAAARAAAAAEAAANAYRPSVSELNYFARVLCVKLLTCCDAVLSMASSPVASAAGHSYCCLVARFVTAIVEVCCRSRHKDALQSIFRQTLAESEFLDRYHNLLLSSADGGGASGNALDGLVLACLRLLLSMRMLEPLALLTQAAQLPLKWNVQRAILQDVVRSCVVRDWTPQQVGRLCSDKHLNFLIADHLEFLAQLCQVRPECGSLLQAVLLRHAHRLNRHSVRSVLRLVWRLCENSGDCDQTLASLQLLVRLHQLQDGQRTLQLPMERLARQLCRQIGATGQRAIYERLLSGELAGGEDEDEMRALLLKDLECRERHNNDDDAQESMGMGMELGMPRIIDESWLFAQLIKFATQHEDAPQQQRQLMRLLLEIQSEAKLQRALRSMGSTLQARLLRHAIDGALWAMLIAFRNNCVQHTPHINYMQMSPLARVACALLNDRLSVTAAQLDDREPPTVEQLDEARALCTLLAATRNIEATALIYIDAKIVEKFVRDNLLNAPPQLFLAYLRCLAQRMRVLLHHDDTESSLSILLECVDAMLQQQFIWREVNACNDDLRSELLDVITIVAQRCLHHTIFYQRQRVQLRNNASFLAEFIEAHVAVEGLRSGDIFGTSDTREMALQFDGQNWSDLQVPLPAIASIGISLLRTHQFYAHAVTPHGLMPAEYDVQQATMTSGTGGGASGGKLPTIPLDCLSDVDVLRKFVKRLSIFGFTTRQQFEEYFMTFLLLINNVYDEHMVDQQEQFQIKQVCLKAIMELLMTYKTFPIVGNGGSCVRNTTTTSINNNSNRSDAATISYFYHTTRWSHINCDSISLKKLHKVQLLIDASNVFYLGNLERQLTQDNVIGTRDFAANQYDLNFSWAQMEAHAQPSPPSDANQTTPLPSVGVDMPSMVPLVVRNYRYFTQQSGIDFRSSTQLVFDVLQQMIELNHILVLPNLVKFCEICESRDQIKWIKERATKLQEQIPMDDTISHQHLIYLLCRTQSLLIPSHVELQHLCALIGNYYLKSSHCFIRNATLDGLLSLLECCSKTNTTIGKLSEDLAMLRDLIVSYINRHGIIDESPLQFSDTHTKLVWTLNYSLIEWTSKFVPHCQLLSNTIIAASNFLKTTNNEDLYLCVLHGLERILVNSGNASPAIAAPTSDPSSNSSSGGSSVSSSTVVTPQLRHKIEKLALELLKMENEKFSIPALKLLLSTMYVGSSAQLENTELSNGIVQDDPEIIAQQTDKVDILLHCIKSSSRDAAWIYGQVLCQIIRDLVPASEILTKVIKEFLAINQPHGDVIAMIVYQVFRSAIDSSYLQMLQDWLICTLPTFLAQPEQQGVWGLSVIFLSASINLHLIKLFPLVLGMGAPLATLATSPVTPSLSSSLPVSASSSSSSSSSSMSPHKLGQHEIALFVTAAQDFHAKLSGEQRQRFRDAFISYEKSQVYGKMLRSLS